jgi:hypothetical protein
LFPNLGIKFVFMFMPAPYDDYKVILLMHRSIAR